MTFDGAAEPAPPRPTRGVEFLLAVVIGAIIAMPFAAGRHPSGAQAVLVLAACVALVTIALAVMAYGSRCQQTMAQRRTAEWPAPDELTQYRQRAHR